MKIKQTLRSRLLRKLAGFSLFEATLGMGIISAVAGAVFSGISTGTLTMRLSRENLRATQIMLEKVETIRLYSWDQVTNSAFIPATFSATYDPQGAPNVGLTYTGTMTIASAPIGASYSGDMRMVTVHLSWQTSGIQQDREFSSYIARNGLQSYIY